MLHANILIERSFFRPKTHGHSRMTWFRLLAVQRVRDWLLWLQVSIVQISWSSIHTRTTHPWGVLSSSPFYVSRDRNTHPRYNTHLLWFLPASLRYFADHTHCGTKITVQNPSLAVLPLVLEILVVLEDQEVQLAQCLQGVHGDPSVLDGLYDQVFRDHLEALFLLEGLFHLWCQALPKWKKYP